MQIERRFFVSFAALTLTAAAIGVWTDASGAGSTPACLAADDVSRIVGLEVRTFHAGTQVYGSIAVCAYEGTDSNLGVFVTTVAGPPDQSDADTVFAAMSESVKLFLGATAEPEPVEVGERGLAYGSSSRSEAAAISGDMFYHAEVVSSASADIGDRKAAMIEIIETLIAQ